MPLFQKSVALIKLAYHFDIYHFAQHVPQSVQRYFIFLSLILPPIAIFLVFLLTAFNLNEFSFSLTTFSKSPELVIPNDHQFFILFVGIIVIHNIVNAALAPIDLLVRAKHQQKPVAWEDCFVFSIASALIGATGALALSTPLLDWLISLVTLFLTALDGINPLVSLPFIWLVLLMYVLDDVFFYIGHRLAHNVRVIWKLGHMQHHRPTYLTSATSASDFGAFFLNGGGGSFVTAIVGKAVFFKLLSTADTSHALLAAFMIAVLKIINHTVSHSYSAYLVFSKYKWLALLERFFVTGRIHYVHHSKLPEHNVASGCNFAAQFVWIDKLMGTYAAPSQQIPPTGLFHEINPPGNPIKFALDQWIKLGRELYLNHPKYWLKILFADPSYTPPNPA